LCKDDPGFSDGVVRLDGVRHLNYRIIGQKPKNPILGHIPHASKHIPADIGRAFVQSDAYLKAELIRMTDAHTDELFGSIKDIGILFVNQSSRLVMDPERFVDDASEVMSKRGMGAVYTKTSDGRPLRRPLTPSERAAIIDGYYKPYHRQLTSEVSQLTKRFGKCLIIDGHSFPSKPLPYELNRSIHRPDICIGTDVYHTPIALREITVRYFKERGLSVSVNRPFSGSLVPMKFYQKTKKVQSIMIEINRRLYMNERTGRKSLEFKKIKKLIDGYIKQVNMWQKENLD
jgi:N-formylglutamate deformylase